MTEAEIIPDDLSPTDALRATEEALRQAVHNSDPTNPSGGIVSAADIYTVIGALGYALELVPELLGHLVALVDLHEARLAASDGSKPADRIAAAHRALRDALDGLAAARTRLGEAQSALAPISGPLS
jgi:hypothetical protein